MALTTKLNLSDSKVGQLSGSTLGLSGNTTIYGTIDSINGYEIFGNGTTITKDESNNLVFKDQISGEATLAKLLDHGQSNNLGWLNSNHSGSTNTIAGFNNLGEAVTIKQTYTSFSSLPLVGNSGIVYLITNTKTQYYWNGSVYVPIIATVGSGSFTTDFTSGIGWDASTNTPEVISSTGNTGDFAIVSVSGVTEIDGISSWGVDDYIWWDSDSNVWRKIDNQIGSGLPIESGEGITIADNKINLGGFLATDSEIVMYTAKITFHTLLPATYDYRLIINDGTKAISIINHTTEKAYINNDGAALFASAIITTATANTLAYFNSSKGIDSLEVTTYPSLTEISYVKGVTSEIQTQLNAKIEGSGTANYVSKWTGASTQGNSIIYDDGTNVGIATTNINQGVTIGGGKNIGYDSNPGDMFIRPNNNTYGGVIRLQSDGSTTTRGVGIGHINATGVYTQTLFVATDGKVGIGKTPSLGTLDVNGTGVFSSTVTATDFIIP